MTDNDRCIRCFEKEAISLLLIESEYLKMVCRKLGVRDISVTNLLGLMLKDSELEIRGDVIAQRVFCKQVLPPVACNINIF
jgi:hypothetical protein